VLAGRVVRDRATGEPRLVLANMNENAGAELLYLDFQHDAAQVYRAPAGAGSWALLEVPADRLIVGTFYDGKFLVFDLRRMEFVHVADFPGESYIWNLALGRDGRVYGGTYPGGKLGALDLETYAVEDCGAPAPPNLYLRHVSATPDGRILCSIGQEKPTVLLYDPAARAFQIPPDSLGGVEVGVAWRGVFLSGGRAFRGEEFTPVPPPFPLPPEDGGAWHVDAQLTSDDALFLRQGNGFYRYAPPESSLSRISEIALRGGWPLAATPHGDVLGVRGQDYFVIRPGNETLALRPIPAESSPRATLFLRIDPAGRIWGGPTFGQTLFFLDLRTGRTVNTGAVCDAGGEVYDVAFLHGNVYAASYSGGDITEYNPDAIWDQWNGANPRRIASVGPKGYIRPTGGICAGPDGRLYSGWMARYGAYGGAIAITDPASGQTTLIENALAEQAVEGLAVDSRYAYVGTSLHANGLPAKRGEDPHFGIAEVASGRVCFSHRFVGATAVRCVALDEVTGLVLMVVDGSLRAFDRASGLFSDAITPQAPRVTSRSVAARGDGAVYYASGRQIVALDLCAGSARVLSEAPEAASNVAVGPDGHVYVAYGVEVGRIRVEEGHAR
jgi:streptogramin lyase